MSENNIKRPFLKRGDGTARFTRNVNMRQNPNNMQTDSPKIQLRQFTIPSSIATNRTEPMSARTVDSGISNTASPIDDYATRPPTGESFTSRPIVLEVEDDEDGDDEYVGEEISARRLYEKHPTFMPDPESTAESRGGETEESEERSHPEPSPAPSSVTAATNYSKASDNAKGARTMPHRVIRFADTQNSVSTSASPGSTSSDIVEPLGQSTPKSSFFGNNYQELSAQSVDLSSVTPVTRPFRQQNIPQSVNNVAQTGISILNPPTQPAVYQEPEPISRRPLIRKQPQQKENIPNRLASIYEEPRSTSRHKEYTELELQLCRQLRDTLAHIDYADDQLRRSAKRFHEETKKYREKQEENHRKVVEKLEKEYARKMEEVEENMRMENDRLKRERREFEREKKQNDGKMDEVNKEQAKTIETLKSRISDLETQGCKNRTEIRSRDEKLKAKDEQIEKLTKESERAKRNSDMFEKQVRNLKREKERREEEELHLNTAAVTRMNRNKLANSKSMGSLTRNEEAPKKRSISWAQPPVNEVQIVGEEETARDLEQLVLQQQMQQMQLREEMAAQQIMHPVNRVMSQYGPIVAWRNHIGDTCQTTTTLDNGTLTEFGNGDKQWRNLTKSVLWYYFAIDSTIIVYLHYAEIMFKFHWNRQLEITRPGNNISLISMNRDEIRTELINRGDGRLITELFDKGGDVITKELGNPDIKRRYQCGGDYTKRDNNRLVHVSRFDDFEYVEPEFRLRYYQGKAIVCKVFGRPNTDEKVLKITIDTATGSGSIESVESKMVNGIAQKKTVFNWSGVTR